MAATAETTRNRFIRLRSRADGSWLVPPELKARLVAEAEASGSNMTAVAEAILAGAYGVPLPERKPRRAAASPDGFEVCLRLPGDLDAAVRAAAAARDCSVQDVIVQVLCGRYGLRPPPRRR